ncbi:type I restriction enzyme HsdR N-terminal domain-containing protein [Cellulomonas sp. C5510]|uniref:type I restriction endonuclease n=1 Tax=Cellulomonas sp. C5510 TaxID=2871170 RepID=UPI001C94633A|nr:type I restriction enzyme HsdR N-terminal domain-containing protein [Cellulomonas sp. C5510]QZN86948.1 type I restriction enzyme HsdR N-terminal domain-containing protein [Cellulomonas sp. C5510]
MSVSKGAGAVELGERLASLASKVEQQKPSIQTEEATKNAFVMPFIALVLGYDVFNPQEVVPEFTADVGIKKGEKIDYAVVKDGEVQMLIECKTVGSPLTLSHASQLFRYFATTNARIAILTNGEQYHFFTDLDRPNRMDDKPFLQLDLTDLDPSVFPEVEKMGKEFFDLDSIVSAAEELKYVGALKRVLAAEFREPGDDWMRLLITRVYDGPITQRVREQFGPLVRKASKQFLADQVNERLKAALGTQANGFSPAPEAITGEVAAEESIAEAENSQDRGVVTTLEELEAFQIIRAIGCSEVPASRIVARDTKSYFGVLLDDNNRKPIARLHFNTSQKYLGLLDEEKVETRHPIDTLEEIYHHADEVRTAVRRYV